jgi:hypothetical protein
LAALLAVTSPAAGPANASSPGTVAAPLLDCPDVNANHAVDAGDILKVVQHFGMSTANAEYRLLYDVAAPVGSVAANDIGAVVLDFGDSEAAGTCPAVDTEIALATLWVIEDHPEFLTEDPELLAASGFFSTQIDAPGQGLHYGRTGSRDGSFELSPPDALIYNNGKLIAQLYYVEANVDDGGVGWGPVEPPPVDQVNIDPICSPQPPATAPCSWSGSEDGWHWHANLCFQHIGTSQEIALPGSPATCNEDDTNCPQAVPNCNQFRARTGWMGHLYNHMANPNGRFADCFPDGAGWKAFNCPQ